MTFQEERDLSREFKLYFPRWKEMSQEEIWEKFQTLPQEKQDKFIQATFTFVEAKESPMSKVMKVSGIMLGIAGIAALVGLATGMIKFKK